MKNKTLKKCLLLLAAVAMTTAMLGCTAKNDSTSDKKVVKLAYVNWAEGVAVTYLMQTILEDMGYEVKTTMADVAPIFASVAGGDQDIMIETWVPTTHKSYWEKFDGQFEELGIWFDTARIGLVAPSYIPIDSIEDLNSFKDELGGKIIGIDSGAGIMGKTEDAIAEYGLDLHLMTSSGPAMVAALKSAIDKNKPVVITGWAPHWKFARYDLKFLEDPKGVFGSDEEIKFICRKGFKEDMPEVAELFSNVKFTLEQIGSLMDAVAHADSSEEEAVASWAEANADIVAGWMPAKTQ
ncbi:MAG: glycine betaine ABC transporter substrate-binding protein [Phycisphaerae bacterium]